MPVKLTPEQYAEKWGRRLKGAIPDVETGVDRVTEAPGKKAAAAKNKWIAKLTSKSVQDKWERRVGAVPLEVWKQKMLTKGVGRIAAGVDDAGPKVTAFAIKLFAHQNSGLTKIDAMADLTLEDSIGRATAWIRHMAAYKG